MIGPRVNVGPLVLAPWHHAVPFRGLRAPLWVSDAERMPCQGSQRWDTVCPRPRGLLRWPGSPQREWGCGAARGQKMAALHCLGRAQQRGHGALRRGDPALAGSPGRWDSYGLDPERQKDHCILEASGPGLHPKLFWEPPGSSAGSVQNHLEVGP